MCNADLGVAEVGRPVIDDSLHRSGSFLNGHRNDPLPAAVGHADVRLAGLAATVGPLQEPERTGYRRFAEAASSGPASSRVRANEKAHRVRSPMGCCSEVVRHAVRPGCVCGVAPVSLQPLVAARTPEPRSGRSGNAAATLLRGHVDRGPSFSRGGCSACVLPGLCVG